MLIHTFPPRLMCRVMAIRAASICRLVTYAPSTAWRPNSPKTTLVPPLAMPRRFGWCCLRCLTLRGISIGNSAPLTRAGRRSRLSRLLLGGRARRGLLLPAATVAATSTAAATATAATTALRALATAAATGGALLRGLRLALGAARRRLTLVDPDLHADAAEGRTGLVEAVVVVRAERVQGHLALAVELRAGHLGAAQAAAALHLDALG